MRGLFSILLVFAFASSDLVAQKASINYYGAPCPSTAARISITGLPKIGTTMIIQASSLLFCTKKFCPCSCCDCNDCGMSILAFGFKKISVPLPFSPSCTVLASLDLLLIGSPTVVIPIPNLPALIKFRFYLQRLDLKLKEVRGSQCPTTYRLQGAGTSNGAECIIGT